MFFADAEAWTGNEGREVFPTSTPIGKILENAIGFVQAVAEDDDKVYWVNLAYTATIDEEFEQQGYSAVWAEGRLFYVDGLPDSILASQAFSNNSKDLSPRRCQLCSGGRTSARKTAEIDNKSDRQESDQGASPKTWPIYQNISGAASTQPGRQFLASKAESRALAKPGFKK